ncbi:MAG: class II aldolase/adducin family protein [Bacteroidales bacterium]|nr:class II aldolase/adducin family protein [Bacteroidales bacterium]MDT8432986.1 class II aldolase/adducin family protein [Bacteroidales bacterium]
MISKLAELVKISQSYGNNHEYVIAGGGNTSFKDDEHLWIKASGTSLATITEEEFAKMDRHCLNKIAEKSYSSDPLKREAEIKEELYRCIAGPKDKRPSVETSLHNLIEKAFVVHTHPALVNALMCAVYAHDATKTLFGDDALFVEYTDPGYILFKLVEKRIGEYKKTFGKEPAIILLENHGVFVAADTPGEIDRLYEQITEKLSARISTPLPSAELLGAGMEGADLQTANPAATGPEIAGLEEYIEELTFSTHLTVKGYSSRLISHFVTDKQAFSRVKTAFTPDQIVYCKAHYMFCESESDLVYEEYLEFEREHGYPPRVIAIKNRGIICMEENEKSTDTVYEVFLDMLKIAWLAENFGGAKPMTDKQITFIDNWEVENYRRKIAKNG